MAGTTVPAVKKAKQPAAKRAVRKMSEDESYKLYRQVLRAPALLTKAELDRAERTANLRDWVRRAMWHFLAMSGKEVVQKSRKDRDTALAWAALSDAAGEYRKSINDILEFLSAMEVRLMVALAVRPDMSEIIAESRRRGTEGESITIDNVDELLRKHESKASKKQ